MGEAVITISTPRRVDGEDRVKLTLHPRVKNYPDVAVSVENILKDEKATFSKYYHTPGSEIWEVALAAGVDLSNVHHNLAARLNYFLPANVRAIPEGAVAAFDERDDGNTSDPAAERLLRTLLDELKGVQKDAFALRKKSDALHARIEALIADTEVALGEHET